MTDYKHNKHQNTIKSRELFLSIKFGRSSGNIFSEDNYKTDVGSGGGGEGGVAGNAEAVESVGADARRS